MVEIFVDVEKKVNSSFELNYIIFSWNNKVNCSQHHKKFVNLILINFDFTKIFVMRLKIFVVVTQYLLGPQELFIWKNCYSYQILTDSDNCHDWWFSYLPESTNEKFRKFWQLWWCTNLSEYFIRKSSRFS